MGQKVNPHGARVGVILDWSTKWYAGKKDFSNNLIEDYNLRKMLKENNCTVIDDNPDPDWIEFQLDGKQFFIRVCGSYCEVHAGIRLDSSYNPAIVRDLCNNDMSHFTCGHIWYDEDNSGLLVTVFSINKTYAHLKASFYKHLNQV